MKLGKRDLEYEKLIISLFVLLVDIYGVDIAIPFIYKINSLKGVKI